MSKTITADEIDRCDHIRITIEGPVAGWPAQKLVKNLAEQTSLKVTIERVLPPIYVGCGVTHRGGAQGVVRAIYGDTLWVEAVLGGMGTWIADEITKVDRVDTTV